jgi:nicotinate-nucleotide adenylyltransferase
MLKVGLLFGSFNPVHYGHLIIAQAFLNHQVCDRVWFVVSPHNPFKSRTSLASELDRLRMVELAIENHHQLQASNVEFFLPRPSYTIDTLTHLAGRYPSYEFILLMGADNLEHIHKWKNAPAVLEHYRLGVYPRPGSVPVVPAKARQVQVVEAPFLDISATFIRETIRNRLSLRYLTPDPVIDYIEQNHLYAG